MDLAPFLCDRGRSDGCRGFIGPFPSTPLDAYGYVEGERITTATTDATPTIEGRWQSRTTPSVAAMPGIPRPRLRRAPRVGVDAPLAHASPEPNVETIEADGLRWINIERPGPIDRAWLEEHFEFHPLDYEDVASRNQRPKIDEYPDYLFIVLHFPVFDKSVGRLNAAELDIFVGPDFLITLPNRPIPPVDYLFERCESSEEVRDALLSKGPGLPALQDRRRLLRLLLPDAAEDGEQARADRGGHLRRPLRGGGARHLQRQAGDHQLPQDHPPAATGAARPRAHQAALHGGRPGRLLRRHRRRLRAHLGHARELQGGRGGARGHQRVGVWPTG